MVHDDDLLLSRQLRFLEDESPWQENYFRPRYGTKIAGLLPVYERSPDGALVGDTAFNCKGLRQILRWLGIEPMLPTKGEDEHGRGVLRWFVERPLSWFHQFRRLHIRWDRKPMIHQAFLSLVAAVICYRRWSRGF